MLLYENNFHSSTIRIARGDDRFRQRSKNEFFSVLLFGVLSFDI